MFLEKVAEIGDWVEIRIAKDVMSENVESFKSEMYGLQVRAGLTVVLNFECVSEMCSRALGVVAVSAWRFRQEGASLKVSNLTPNLRRIFNYARLDLSVAAVDGMPPELSRGRLAA